MKRIKFLVFFCILSFAVSCGQQKRYVSYKVKKGETMRSIANNLDIKTRYLLRLNPDVGRRPKPNTVIIIPSKKGSQIADNTKIEEGNTTEQVIVTKTEEIIPEKNIDPELEALKKDFLIHKVKPKETVYGLKRFYNVTEEDLFSLNPTLASEGLKIGQLLKIKPIKTEDDIKANDIYEDNFKAGKTINLAMLLPFRASKYSENTPNDIFKKNRLANMVTDFYMGAEIAIDSIESQGITVNVSVFDTDKRNSKINEALSNSKITAADVIIGPFYSDEAKKVASSVKIPVVFPHFSSDQKYFSSSKLVKTAPNKNNYEKFLVSYLSENYAGETIIVVGDGKTKSNSTVNYIVSNLKKHDSIATVTVLKPVKGYIKKQRFIDVLKPGKKNWIIIVSDDKVAVADALNSTISLPNETTTQVFTVDKNKAFNTIDNNKLARIGFTYITDAYIDESTYATRVFNKKYKSKNNSLPSDYSTKGFDITYDILARLASGSELKDTFKEGTSFRLVSKFDYDKKLFGAINNNGLFIVKYNEDLSLTRLK